MNSQIEDALVLRRKFVDLFVSGMNERVDYRSQFSYFYFMFASLPLLIATVVILLAVCGFEISGLIGLILIGYAIMYVVSIVSLVVEDICETNHCLWEITFDNTEMQKGLRDSAPMQWDDELKYGAVCVT